MQSAGGSESLEESSEFKLLEHESVVAEEGCAGQDECGRFLVAAVSHLAGQLLVLLHQLLVLLVDGQHLADTVGSCLGLRERRITINVHFERIFSLLYILFFYVLSALIH